MTVEQIIYVARITAEVLTGTSELMTKQEEQAIVDTYYNRYGCWEEEVES